MGRVIGILQHGLCPASTQRSRHPLWGAPGRLAAGHQATACCRAASQPPSQVRAMHAALQHSTAHCTPPHTGLGHPGQHTAHPVQPPTLLITTTLTADQQHPRNLAPWCSAWALATPPYPCNGAPANLKLPTQPTALLPTYMPRSYMPRLDAKPNWKPAVGLSCS
jgi:hypothetical protein